MKKYLSLVLTLAICVVTIYGNKCSVLAADEGTLYNVIASEETNSNARVLYKSEIKGVRNLNNGKYYPHLVIKGSEQLLGVNFIDGEDVIFDQPIRANALPVNEDIDYSSLQEGRSFLIMEGSTIVGEGIVQEIFQHKPYGKK